MFRPVLLRFSAKITFLHISRSPKSLSKFCMYMNSEWRFQWKRTIEKEGLADHLKLAPNTIIDMYTNNKIRKQLCYTIFFVNYIFISSIIRFVCLSQQRKIDWRFFANRPRNSIRKTAHFCRVNSTERWYKRLFGECMHATNQYHRRQFAACSSALSIMIRRLITRWHW